MSTFFWASGHLGWGLFALLVFSAVWLLLSDLVWRLVNLRARRWLLISIGGWCAGAVAIAWACHTLSM